MSLPPMSMLRWTCQPVIAGSRDGHRSGAGGRSRTRDWRLRRLDCCSGVEGLAGDGDATKVADCDRSFGLSEPTGCSPDPHPAMASAMISAVAEKRPAWLLLVRLLGLADNYAEDNGRQRVEHLADGKPEQQRALDQLGRCRRDGTSAWPVRVDAPPSPCSSPRGHEQLIRALDERRREGATAGIGQADLTVGIARCTGALGWLRFCVNP